MFRNAAAAVSLSQPTSAVTYQVTNMSSNWQAAVDGGDPTVTEAPDEDGGMPSISLDLLTADCGHEQLVQEKNRTESI